MNVSCMTSDRPQRRRLSTLAPSDLRARRTTRFHGEALAVALADFSKARREGLRTIYQLFREIFRTLDTESDSQQALELCQMFDADFVIETLRGLADDISLNDAPLKLRQVIHDLRGGSVLALLSILQSVQMGDVHEGDLSQMKFLSRDAMKVMRNCILDLDPERRKRDLEQQDHDIRFLFQKWEGWQGSKTAQNSVYVHVTREFDAVVSECCMELATLDRVITNLIDNASRHCSDGQVYLDILFPAPDSPSVRMVVANRISVEQRATLRPVMQDGARGLFGRFTTTGSGLGMGIVADFVAQAFGLKTLSDAVRDGYVGATLDDAFFYAWIHWPGIEGHETSDHSCLP